MNTTDQDRLWQNKLLALLHDPPEKAYDFGPAHAARAEHYAARFGLSQDAYKNYKNSDWSSAAADRFIFPSGRAVDQKLGDGIGFKHPMSGEQACRSDDFPSHEKARDVLDSICPQFSNPDLTDRERFFLTWRLWMEYAASHKDDKADFLPYLPADTRIPDGTIWLHNAVTSAMESTRDAHGVLRPAFFLFQIGPVQEFIAQARTTRDLWSGSYLIAWLMAYAIKHVSDTCGPDCVLFPSLRGQPLFDWLNRDILNKARHGGSMNYIESITRNNRVAWEDMILTPTMPNCFLALVPETFEPEATAAALKEEWTVIVNNCAEFLDRHGCPIDQTARFDYQVQRAWDITWQLWPWQPTGPALEMFKNIPLGQENALSTAYTIAHAIPAKDRDNRCFRDGELNSGWAWTAHYQLCRHRLDARRQTRDFNAWQGEPKTKDVYSGREEIVIDENWLGKVRGLPELGHLFRGEHMELLGAVNLVKRVWHKAYLDKIGLKRARQSFDSVPAVAAAPWRAALLRAAGDDHQTWQALLELQKSINQNTDLPIEVPSSENEKQWFDRADASIFHDNFWEQNKSKPAAKAQAALNELIKVAQAGRPQKYYAVLAMDGDEMGKWLSGAKTPAVKKVITPAAGAYFAEALKEVNVDQWLNSPRPISPAYHLQFSEALANFGLYCARRIIEHHHGQLIYSGGDDVLAMLPATEAIACACGLRMAFQGDAELAKRYPAMFRETQPGFVQLRPGNWESGARRDAEPCWPLLVPGPHATVSAGLAIGHIREPLQDMVHAAHESEKRAKSALGRDALALTLFKRSGEQIQWGTKFRPEPFRLLDFLNRGDTYKPPVNDPRRPMPISGKFPYRICELLHVYARRMEKGDDTQPTLLDDELHTIAQKEIAWAIQQLRSGKNQFDPIFNELQSLTGEWLDAVHEPPSGSIEDFYNLFAVEAFIARQGE